MASVWARCDPLGLPGVSELIERASEVVFGYAQGGWVSLAPDLFHSVVEFFDQITLNQLLGDVFPHTFSRAPQVAVPGLAVVTLQLSASSPVVVPSPPASAPVSLPAVSHQASRESSAGSSAGRVIRPLPRTSSRLQWGAPLPATVPPAPATAPPAPAPPVLTPAASVPRKCVFPLERAAPVVAPAARPTRASRKKAATDSSAKGGVVCKQCHASKKKCVPSSDPSLCTRCLEKGGPCNFEGSGAWLLLSRVAFCLTSMHF